VAALVVINTSVATKTIGATVTAVEEGTVVTRYPLLRNVPRLPLIGIV